MREVERFEYKYALDYKTYLAFKSRISMFMEHDPYTKKADSDRYFVRSLYFDTYNYQHYLESEDGLYGRIKCRIRTYHTKKADADVVSIEIKTKKGSSVKKYSQLIPFEEYHYFVKNGYFPSSSSILDEFTRLMYQAHLEPKLIVEYEREGYESIDGSNLRVTFDFDVRSVKTEELFHQKTMHLRAHNYAVVCEIKCSMNQPEWLESLIKYYGLKIVGNSKYIQAVDRIFPSMIYGREPSINLYK